ncbi:hypothetical protein TWF102_000496 [Orbilia oligospora]|uniref:F-box domain-containing protein n=1 Tax=Orbilia oligospora TaxID=2813651 RepID=A0A7C8N3S3_ORBOL|nr:hypothetical protein TWF102_000496 [Orbilia oligospora]KAF3097109.1 hypothetical protein TWF103_009635 [Orbilia oligospora]KAF3117091.1 hypothetical protein TWF706_000292 [Orbilia oligospora]KAF3136646.1 hypothetical protein TWF703_005360 [Orbilia oligospora]KAF3141846.1 hypothetical protein TWF594_005903 [Orbilia oligospora]
MITLKDLPVEIHIQILFYLDWRSKYYCSLASKTWRDVLLVYGQDSRLADCSHYEDTIRVLGQQGNPLPPRRPGYHTLFQGNLVCYMKLGSEGNIKAVAFGPRLKALSKPIKLSSPTMQYPIITSLSHCFLLNDPIFKKPINLPDDGTGDPRRMSLEMSVGNNNTRCYVENKVWLFSEEARINSITIKEFLNLVVDNLREHASEEWLTNRKWVMVRIRRSNPFLITIYAELFEAPLEPIKKKGKFRHFLTFWQRSRSEF